MPGLALWKGFLNPNAWLGTCAQNPMPLPAGLNIFQAQNAGGVLRHKGDFTVIQIRSDFALWCCQCNRFVSKSETVQGTADGYGSDFNGVF